MTALARAGLRIRAARKAAGLSTHQLAAVLGVSPSAVIGWENGKRDPGVGGLARVAAALGVTAASLLAEDAGAAFAPADLRHVADRLEKLAGALRAAAAEGSGE